MNRLGPVLLAGAASLVAASSEPVPVDAEEGILERFETVPLVAFAETHGSTRQHAFLRGLVANRRLGRTIDDVVVEFGNARYQVTADRYVRGEQVPHRSLSRIWRLTTQTSGVWEAPIYEQFFRAVRAANRGKPPSERIRVLLGDPPIDWRRIRTASCPGRTGPHCLEYWIGRRNEHYAGVVLEKVLARRRRALLVAGAFHFVRGIPNETALIERRQPGSVSVVFAPEAFHGPEGQEVERRLRAWPVPSLASVRGTWLGALSPRVVFGGEAGDDHPLARGRLEDRIDGLLYLG